MAIKKIKIGNTEHELQTTIANVTNLQSSLDSKYQIYTNSIFVEGDANTYYPVAIPMKFDKDWVGHISVWKDLGSTTPSSYSGNHGNGTSSLWLLYEGRSTTWDGNGGFVKTIYKYQGYATLVARAHRGANATQWLFVWLRGGGCSYNISTDYDCSINIYYSATNLGNSTYPINVEPMTSIGNGGILYHPGDGWIIDGHILDYHSYGTSLPSAGIPGRIFYKKV